MNLPLYRYRYSTDAQLTADLMASNSLAVRYVFYEQYTPLLRHNAQKASAGKIVEYDDLLQELYLYLSANGWEKLRHYDATLPFVNWFSVVSYRFFKDFSRSMIDSARQVPISALNDPSESAPDNGRTMATTLLMDIREALAKLQPPRDRHILEALLLRDETPESVADRHNITVDNLYNIKRRTLAKLAQKLSAYQ